MPGQGRARRGEVVKLPEFLNDLCDAAPAGSDPLNEECGSEISVVGALVVIGQPGYDGCITIDPVGVARVWNRGDADQISGIWFDAYMMMRDLT